MINIDYKFIASEIVRSMTNFDLTEKQKDELKYRAEQVLLNNLVYNKIDDYETL